MIVVEKHDDLNMIDTSIDFGRKGCGLRLFGMSTMN